MHNEKIIEKMNSLSKPMSSVKSQNIVISRISRSEIVQLNSSIQQKIDQNKMERNASWIDGKDKIVGAKVLKLKKEN